MAKATTTTFGGLKFLAENQASLEHRGQDQLGYAIATIHREGGATVIDQGHPNLPAVIGIDGTRPIDYSDPISYGKPASGANLHLISVRYCNTKPCLKEVPLPWLQGNGAFDSCSHIHTRGRNRVVLWQRKVLTSPWMKPGNFYDFLFHALFYLIAWTGATKQFPLPIPNRAPKAYSGKFASTHTIHG